MLTIGLTGNIAAGKSTVARLFTKWGATLIDADALVRELQLPGQPVHHAISERFGQQVLTVDAKGVAVCLPLEGDQLAVIGDNGKILVFPLEELPEMPRGKGVKLQSYREGGLRDGLVFSEADGPTWPESGGRKRQWPDWRDWIGRRASAGKLGPRGMKRLGA